MAKRHNRRAPIYEYQPLHITGAGTNIAVGTQVSTTSTTAITAGNTVTVTPAAMTNIIPGMALNISHGTGTAEDVVVISTTATTFTALFQNAHSGTYNICSWKSTFVKGININQSGTAFTLNLFNGNQNAYFAGGTTTPSAFASIVTTAAIPVSHIELPGVIDHGLFYTLSGITGTVDFTLWYADEY